MKQEMMINYILSLELQQFRFNGKENDIPTNHNQSIERILSRRDFVFFSSSLSIRIIVLTTRNTQCHIDLRTDEKSHSNFFLGLLPLPCAERVKLVNFIISTLQLARIS